MMASFLFGSRPRRGSNLEFRLAVAELLEVEELESDSRRGNLHRRAAVRQSSTRCACRLRAARGGVAGNVEVDARSRKIKEIRVRALHQEIHDSIHRIDPSTYIGSDGVRCVEP